MQFLGACHLGHCQEHLVTHAPPTCYPCYVQVHLLVDTTLTNGKFSINAFMSRLLTLGDKVGASAGGG